MRKVNGVLYDVEESDLDLLFSQPHLFWKDVHTIGEKAFTRCKSIKSINIPSSIQVIESSAFALCENLKIVILNEGLETIENKAFEKCKSIEELVMPSTLQSIHSLAFYCCRKLKAIKLNNGLNYIGEYVFHGTNLTTLTIPGSVKFIEANLFGYSTTLKELVLEEGIERIKRKGCFGLAGLERVRIPSSVRSLGEEAFSCCYSLKEIVLPEGVREIGDKCFRFCNALREVNLSNNIETVGNQAFKECNSIERIIFHSLCDNVELDAFDYFENVFLYGSDEKFIISKYLIDDENYQKLGDSSELFFIQYNEYALKTILETGSVLLDRDIEINKYLKYVKFQLPYSFVINLQAQDEDTEFISRTNFKAFKRVCKRLPKNLDVENLMDFYAFSYAIGCWSTDPDLNLKANNWLEDKIVSGQLDVSSMHALFSDFLVQGEDKEFAEFLFGKDAQKQESTFSELKKEKNYGHLLSKIYLEYKNKETGLINGRYRDIITGKLMFRFYRESVDSNGVRSLKEKDLVPTLSLFKEYFSKIKFSGVATLEDEAISKELSKWPGMTQVEFDLAKAVMWQYRLSRVRSNIVGKHLKDMSNEVVKKISSLGVDSSCSNAILDRLKEVQEKEFTYEWLEKNDPINFVLGLYCNCCASLSGSGYGIVRASILHPNMQTLIIRDKKGIPVAKSTIYINIKEGYAVFNTIEVAHNMLSFRDEIYKEYMNGVEIFIKTYNEKYPSKPLKKVTVGMNLNDLSKQIKYDKEESEVLPAINFAKYGSEYKDYQGDWQKAGQYTLWEDSEYRKIGVLRK